MIAGLRAISARGFGIPGQVTAAEVPREGLEIWYNVCSSISKSSKSSVVTIIRKGMVYVLCVAE